MTPIKFSTSFLDQLINFCQYYQRVYDRRGSHTPSTPMGTFIYFTNTHTKLPVFQAPFLTIWKLQLIECTTPDEVDVLIMSALQMRKLRHRAFIQLSQGHTGSWIAELKYKPIRLLNHHRKLSLRETKWITCSFSLMFGFAFSAVIQRNMKDKVSYLKTRNCNFT